MAVLTANPSQKSTKRYPFLDELRGAAILMMIAYHLLYDGVVFAGWDIPLFSPPLSIWQDSIGALFILLSGCMCRLSRSNWRRGLRCLAAACVITAVTFFLVPTVADWFGVLHFLGCAMLLYPVFALFWTGSHRCPAPLPVFCCSGSPILSIGGKSACSYGRWIFLPFFIAISPPQFWDFHPITLCPAITTLCCPGSSCFSAAACWGGFWSAAATGRPCFALIAALWPFSGGIAL